MNDSHIKMNLVQTVVDHEFDSVDEWSQAFKYQLVGRIMRGSLTQHHELVKALKEYDE